jgi:hypothetical protein
MAVLTGQAKIDQQAKVTALANDTTNASNELIGQSDFLISEANKSVTINPNVGVRFGGNDPDPIAVANSKSSLTIQKIDIRKRIRYNQEFITNFSDETKSWVNDPAITSARQQVQTSTLALETSLAKIDETLATLNGAGPQIAATAETRNTTQDTAQRDVANSTSPAVVESGTSPLPANQLTKLNTNSGPNSGVIPNVSDKVEPALESARPGITLTTPEVGVTAKRIYPEEFVKPVPNVLHQYASYTYGLSLHLLTADEYNRIVDKGEYTPTKVLIASAGRYNNTPGPTQFTRSPYFKEDFYFDGFELDTVIGLNAESRSTNAIQYQFTLIEPYGFTLIDRIISLCNSDEIQCNNYLDMPYLLQIDFFGIDDSGQITGAIPNTTKRIPIRLNKMDVKISARGAEYAIKGVPYNHSAYDLVTLTTPGNFEVEAATIGQFFQSDETAGDTTDTSSQRESAQSGLWARNDGRLVGPDGQFVPVNTLNQSLLSIKTKRELGLIKSFGTALNNFQKAAFDDHKIQFNDKYVFNIIDPEKGPKLSTSPFTSGSISSPKNTGMVSIDARSGLAKDDNTKKGDLGLNTNSYRPDLRLFQINAGTYIDQVISWVVRNSKWMTDQIVIPDGVENVETYLQDIKAQANQPLYWFKIVPSIKLLNFDNIRKIWAREITYHIQTYEVRNLKIAVGPGGTAGQAENPKPPVKSYDYIYTGKNNDILDLDIQFNALYYSALTLYRTSAAKITQLATPGEEEKDKNPKTKNIGVVQDPNAIMPMVMKPQILDARTTTGSGALTPKQIAVADLEASLLTLSQADMLHVKLKIIGDPSFIKQDELFWTPKANSQVSENLINADDRLTPDGSLKMDNGEVYVNLTFRTPVDVDETTGMMNFTNENILGPMQTSLFSGLYRVLKVTNEFRNGQFTQTLNLIRLPRQDKLDYADNKPPTSDERNILLGQTVAMDNLMIAPDFTTSDSAKRSTVESDDTAQSAQQQQANNRTDESDRTKEEQELVETRALAAEEPISVTNEPVEVPPGPAENTSPPIRLPDGVTQDPRSGNYTYKGLVIPADPGTSQFNQYVTAVDNKQTIQVTQIDNVSGNPITRTFDGNYTQAAVERAQNNVTFAERELARLENKVRTDPEFRNLNAEQQTNLDVALARRKAEVSAAKSNLEQAKVSN